MKPLLLLVATISPIAVARPAWSQAMDHSTMPGMTMPTAKPPARTNKPPARTKPAAKPAARPVRRAPVRQTPATRQPAAAADPACPPEHAAMGHCTPKSVDTRPAMLDPAPAGTALTAGNAPAPAAPEPSYADRVWGRDAMAPARAALRREHGGSSFSQIMFNLAEYQVGGQRDGYRWDGEGWFGGDIDRIVMKSEGAGDIGGGVEDAEIQALYSRAIGPYFNLQAGIRHDVRPRPSRTYATIGFEGLAPYWFEVEGALFLSDKGDVLARLEGYYDQRITQRLILQPRIEVNLAAQDVRATGVGSGLSDAEVGLRLRYEIVREFAPYVGVSWDRKAGATARLARAVGEPVLTTGVVLGIRTWF